MSIARNEGPEAPDPGSPAEHSLGPTVAGTWYPAEPEILGRTIDGLLDAESGGCDSRDRVRALIAPHAGIAYSGAVAGKGFATIRGRSFPRIVLLGPSHTAAFRGAAVPRATGYLTPLGKVPLDTEATRSLSESDALRADDGPFRREHCLEAEIVFLQRALPEGWRLVPLLIGAGSDAADAEAVARALRPWIARDTLIVVSSDFTHFGPRFNYQPFEQDVQERIENLDRGAIERIVASDREGFREYVRRTGATICGRDAINVLFGVLPAGLEGELVAYDTSGRITGRWDHSVSYASVAFRGKARESRP